MRMFGLVSRGVMFALIVSGLFVSESDAQSKTRSSNEPFTTGSSDEIIKFINERIRQGWEDNVIEPSPVADDSEWVRRVHLDIVGHIPAAEVVDDFLKDKDPAKRSKMIDKLLASDRSMALVIAIETALEDQRLEEAAKLRDELRELRDEVLRSVDEV